MILEVLSVLGECEVKKGSVNKCFCDVHVQARGTYINVSGKPACIPAHGVEKEL